MSELELRREYEALKVVENLLKRTLITIQAERDAMQRRAETAEADWQAAEVTIARFTEQRLQDIAIWERRIDEAGAERDACRRNATLAVRRENEALQQRVARLTEALENLVEHLHDEECARAGCKYYRQASAALAVVRGEG